LVLREREREKEEEKEDRSRDPTLIISSLHKKHIKQER
jgi:hypothetical protein